MKTDILMAEKGSDSGKLTQGSISLIRPLAGKATEQIFSLTVY